MAITPLWRAGMETGDVLEFSATNGSGTEIQASATTSKTGTYAFRILSANTGRYGAYHLPSATAQARVGFHLSPQNAFSTEATYCILMAGTTELAYLGWESGNLSLGVNGAEVDTATALTPGQWVHVGIDAKMDSSNGWVYVYIDGVLTLSYTGNTGATQIDRVRFGLASRSGNLYATNSPVYFDDMCVDDSTGEPAPSTIQDRRLVYLTPNSDDVQEWTPSTGTDHYALVDEKPTSGTDYLSATSAGLVDTFGMSVPTLPTGFVVGSVWVQAIAYKSNAAVATTLTPLISDGGVDDYGTEQALPTTAGRVYERFATQPSGAIWSNSALYYLKFGISSSGDYV